MRAKSDLRPYQQRTVSKLYESEAVQAVLPMGAGKTAAALTAIQELIDDGEIRCALVIAPKRVAQLVWPAEVKEWAHLTDMRVVNVVGATRERVKALTTDAELYVIGINHTPWLADFLRALPEDHRLFDLLVIDESSKLKNPRGKWGKKLTQICRRWRNKWWLTGTPRPNGYIDQFRPLAILTGGKVWGTMVFDRWRQRHFEQMDYMGYDWRMRPEHEQEIIERISSVTFTIDPAEMPELPELVPPIIHWVDLPAGARGVYDQMERELLAEIDNNPAILAANAGVMTGKLEQAANGFMYDETGDAVSLHDAKADMLEQLVESLDGYPGAMVYQFIEDLDTMRDRWPGLPYFGAGVTDKQAALYEKLWNAQKLPLLGMHPASAGHGLNLQHGGNQVIWYGMTWSAELFDQLIKRFHRPGQTERVFNHLILARGTIDEVKLDRVVNKTAAQDAFTKYLKRI